MKKILINEDGYEYGPFNIVTQNDVGYVCDNVVYQTNITGTVSVSEVADDYETPNQIAVYNEEQRAKRAEAYKEQTDAMYFQAQRGDITEQDWLDAVDAIKAKYPYKV